MARTDPAAAARRAMPERYGRRSLGGRIALVASVVLLVGGGLGWLTYAAVEGSSPDVDAGVRTFEVVSERRTTITMEVVRRTNNAVRCEVYAAAADLQVVGERSVRLPAAPPGTETVTVAITTERQATTAAVRGCTTVAG